MIFKKILIYFEKCNCKRFAIIMNLFNEEKVIEMEYVDSITCGQLEIGNKEYFFAKDDRFIARASDTEIDKSSLCNGLFFDVNTKILGYWVTTLPNRKRNVPFIIEKHNVVDWESYCSLVHEYREILNKYRNYSIYDLVYDATEGKSITGGQVPTKEITSSQNMNYRMYFYKNTGKIIVRARNRIQVVQDIVFFNVNDFVAFAKGSGKYCVEHNLDFMEGYIKGGLIYRQYLKFTMTNENILVKVKNIEETFIKRLLRLCIDNSIMEKNIEEAHIKRLEDQSQTSFVDSTRESAKIYTRKESDFCIKEGIRGGIEVKTTKRTSQSPRGANIFSVCSPTTEFGKLPQFFRGTYETDYEYCNYEFQKYGILSQLTTPVLLKQLKKSLDVYFKEKNVGKELRDRISKLAQICLSRTKMESRNGIEAEQDPLISNLEIIMEAMGIPPIGTGVMLAEDTIWQNHFDNDSSKKTNLSHNLQIVLEELNKKELSNCLD